MTGPGVAPFDAAAYPGPRPEGPVLVHHGRVRRVAVDGPAETPIRPIADPDTAAEVGHGRVADDPSVLAALHEVRWSVAYGSNASPGRLVSKHLTVEGALLLPARLCGWVPAFEGRRTGYGAVPLTLVPRAGAVTDTWVLGVPPGATDLLDLTEGRTETLEEEAVGGGTPAGAGTDGVHAAPPGSYRLGGVGEVAVADRFRLVTGFAYLPGPDTSVQVDEDGAWRTWPEVDQHGATEHLERGGPTTAAPHVASPVIGPWPATPLRDLPLFVYGSLRPGRTAWHRIADRVRHLGPTHARGQLHDSGAGWPAATIEGSRPAARRGNARDEGVRAVDGPDDDARRGGEVHGDLLEIAPGVDVPGLLAELDDYEGAPDLFERRAVPVVGAAGPRWALTYVWAGPRLPGRPLPGGAWPPAG
jgi:gamma-glutamylcyclotransferase (GGCT)/AIG2-like uncharacterized protein YtfP